MHSGTLWLLLLSPLSAADVQMSNLFSVHSPTCDQYDVNGLRDDASDVASACEAALRDLRMGTWDGKARQQVIREARGGNNAAKKVLARNLNRLENAHNFLGTTSWHHLRKEKRVVLHSKLDMSIIDTMLERVQQLRSYVDGESHGKWYEGEKPFLSCGPVWLSTSGPSSDEDNADFD